MLSLRRIHVGEGHICHLQGQDLWWTQRRAALRSPVRRHAVSRRTDVVWLSDSKMAADAAAGTGSKERVSDAQDPAEQAFYYSAGLACLV